MNLINNQYPAFPATPQGLLSDGGCGCHRAVREGQSLLASLNTSTTAATSSLAGTTAHARALDWQGNAAMLFRQRMGELLSRATALCDECRATERMARGAGA
ncbi:hypothetical protein PT282_03110 [Bifidobacterium sp. ESL0763]|uniref:hypothetical protein n=1 Tax=Bifidobacterium sp. ESL0763 TaxID=2983227 RepID=UPI0023F89B86|nr:hypothetical protein [Bifidobacterium sp. ESL0763]MDF7663657.1 hypothetical protein [Bifidobacterium sp. ESL0763]